MTITTKTTLDSLCENSVSVLKQDYITVGNADVQIGDNHRRAFVKAESGRAAIAEYIGEPYISAVFQVWGETPTVTEPIEETAETTSEDSAEE